MNAWIPRPLWLVCTSLFLCSTLLAQSSNLAEMSVRARQLMAAGQYEQASQLYRGLVRALPENAGLKLDLGIALYMAGHNQSASQELERAATLEPQNYPAHLYLGYAYLSLGKAAQAIIPLEEAVREKPRNVDARANLARALLASGEVNGAAKNYALLVKLNPASAEAWYGLGRCYQRLSQRAFETLGKVAPGSAYWLALVAKSNAKADRYSSAFYLYRQALAKEPGIYGVHRALAQIYRATGHPQWATAEANKETRPDCARDPLECEYLSGHFMEVVSGSSESPEALYWMSRAYDRLALQAFLRLTRLPPSPPLHELMAELHETSGNYTVAVQEWKQAYALSHEDPEIGESLAAALIHTSDYREAKPLLESLLRQQPQSAEVNYLLGLTLFNLQQPAQAIPYCQKALDLNRGLLVAQIELGRAYLQTGQSAQAIPHLEAALSLDGDGSLHYQLARAYLATGQRKLAAQALQTYQKLHLADEQEAETLKRQVRVAPPN
jgi:tetratricopeptide (TPR) repeat protein